MGWGVVWWDEWGWTVGILWRVESCMHQRAIKQLLCCPLHTPLLVDWRREGWPRASRNSIPTPFSG